MKKKGYSRKNFFGDTIHYDAKGKKIGESRVGFLGQINHYDAKGKKTGESRPAFFGGTNHYDADGHKTGFSPYDIVPRSHSGVSRSYNDYDEIQDGLYDECIDEDEAMEYLEDHGYDFDDFNF